MLKYVNVLEKNRIINSNSFFGSKTYSMHSDIKFLAFFYIFFILTMGGGSNSLDSGEDVPVKHKLGFQIEKSTHVHIWVENTYHTRVKTILDEEREPGVYQEPLGSDSDGNRLPKGMYTYYLETEYTSDYGVFLIDH